MNKKNVLISGVVGIMTLFTLAENNARRIDSEDALGGHIASPTANAKPSDWDIWSELLFRSRAVAILLRWERLTI